MCICRKITRTKRGYRLIEIWKNVIAANQIFKLAIIGIALVKIK